MGDTTAELVQARVATGQSVPTRSSWTLVSRLGSGPAIPPAPLLRAAAPSTQQWLLPSALRNTTPQPCNATLQLNKKDKLNLNYSSSLNSMRRFQMRIKRTLTGGKPLTTLKTFWKLRHKGIFSAIGARLHSTLSKERSFKWDTKFLFSCTEIVWLILKESHVK